MIDRGRRRLVRKQVNRAVEVRDIENVRARQHPEIGLVQLIADKQVLMILGQPVLMDETEVRIDEFRNRNG